MSENDRAREWIARALVVGSEDPLHRVQNVACGYTKLGETERALDLLERMLPECWRGNKNVDQARLRLR